MKKEETIQIRVTPLQKEAIKRLACRLDKSISELIIEAVTIYGSEREREGGNMREMEKFKEVFGAWESALNILIEDAPLGALPLANTLVDVILKKTLSKEKDLPEELIDTMESGLIVSIIYRWYALDPDDLGTAMLSEETREIVKKCKLFIAKMREEFDDGKAKEV